MSAYSGRYAQLYDLFYSAKPYRDEARFIHRCLQQLGSGPVSSLLDLACGTGSHAFELEKLGLHVTGVDYSEDMIRAARVKAQAQGSRVEFRSGDMRAFDFAGAQFDAVACLFDAIGYVHTDEGLRVTLENVRRHLKPGGLFVFEFWHAPAMLKHHDPVRVRSWPVELAEILRISQTELDPAQNLATVRYRVFELRHDGTYASSSDTQVCRYFQVAEMAAFVTDAGLRPVRWLNGFSMDEAISDQTWHVLGIAQRPA